MTVQHPVRGACLQVLEWLMLVGFAGLLCLHTLPNAWRTLNTDFPNYYLTAQLLRNGVDTSQAYDWRWLQRQKDHGAMIRSASQQVPTSSATVPIDQRIVGLAPITPFSTLFVWPLTGWPPLQAKHIWLLVQLALLIPIALALRDLTGQPLRRIALLTLACLPVHRNLLYGQFYILLLAMLVGACWAYYRQHAGTAGVLVALAAMTKVFPIVFLLYFLRKRDTRALLAASITLIACISLSIAAFSWPMHRMYLLEVLPSTLRGEALPPYTLASGSLSTLLHRLFLYEPQWNPHPWHNAPLATAILAPLLQLFLLAPALLLISPRADRTRASLEWSALLCATLAISTSPASYNFTLLIFPVVVLCTVFERRLILTASAVLLFFAIGYPAWNTANVDGPRAILHEPRLLLLIAFTALCCLTLNHLRQHPIDRLWAAALVALTSFSIVLGVLHQRGIQRDFRYRVAMPQDAPLFADPTYTPSGIQAIALQRGYRLISGTSSKDTPDGPDQLSFTTTSKGDWIEQPESAFSLRPPPGSSFNAIQGARSPILLANGSLVYLREELGRAKLFAQGGRSLTPTSFNVLTASASPDSTLFVSAVLGTAPPQLFHLVAHQPPQPLNVGEAHDPAVSPDGRWLAFSGFQLGAWNLHLLDLTKGTDRRLDQVSCNQVQPSWEPDSKTILYASDCGRARGFTALCRRRVLP